MNVYSDFTIAAFGRHVTVLLYEILKFKIVRGFSMERHMLNMPPIFPGSIDL
jgi:hypothetical protein